MESTVQTIEAPSVEVSTLTLGGTATSIAVPNEAPSDAPSDAGKPLSKRERRKLAQAERAAKLADAKDAAKDAAPMTALESSRANRQLAQDALAGHRGKEPRFHAALAKACQAQYDAMRDLAGKDGFDSAVAWRIITGEVESRAFEQHQILPSVPELMDRFRFTQEWKTVSADSVYLIGVRNFDSLRALYNSLSTKGKVFHIDQATGKLEELAKSPEVFQRIADSAFYSQSIFASEWHSEKPKTNDQGLIETPQVGRPKGGNRGDLAKAVVTAIDKKLGLMCQEIRKQADRWNGFLLGLGCTPAESADIMAREVAKQKTASTEAQK